MYIPQNNALKRFIFNQKLRFVRGYLTDWRYTQDKIK